jgi:hypothetical protein
MAVTLFSSPAAVRAAGDTPQEITFNEIDQALLSDDTLELSPTSDSGLTVVLEAVESDGICEVTGLEVTLLALGDCNLSATQPGNATYAAAEPVDRSFVIVDDLEDSITLFELNEDNDMEYGLSYEVEGLTPVWAHRNYFSIDVDTDNGSVTPEVTSQTPGVCAVSGVDGTVGYFLGAGECVMSASIYEGDDDDVLTSIRIHRGDATLIPENYVANTQDYSTGIAEDGIRLLDMFDRPSFPNYVHLQNNLPRLHIDGSAGVEFEGGEDECSGASDGIDPSIDTDHAGTCLVFVHVMKQSDWLKSEISNVNVTVEKMNRGFTSFDYGVSDGYGRNVARTTEAGFLGDPYFIEASHAENHWDEAEEDAEGIVWTLVSGNCDLSDYDDTVGVLTPSEGDTFGAHAGGDQCKVRLTLPETQDYNAAAPINFTMKFMKEPGKIVFAKIPNFVMTPGGGNVFNVDAFVKSLSSGRTHMAYDHRPRLSFSGACNETDNPAATSSDNPHNTTTDRSTGYVTGAGLCNVVASVESSYSVSAQRVSRTFSISKSPNVITFGTISNWGAGETLVQGEHFNVNETYFNEQLSTSSAACSVSYNEGTELWEIELLSPGRCKVTASHGATARVKAAVSVSRIFTVTKAVGRIEIGVDRNQNGHFSDMYLPDEDCYESPGVGCFIGGDKGSVLYNSVNNRVFDIDSVDNSDGTVTYSKLSGECTVSNAAKTVTITGRNSDGTCVVRATLGASVDKTADSDTFTLNINKSDATIGFWTTPGPLSIGSNVTLNGASASGTVVYTTSNSGICTAAGSTLTPVGVGTCTVYANVPANDRFEAAPEREYSVSVSKATQTITFTLSIAERTYPSGGNTITVSPTTTGGGTVTVATGPGSAGCSTGGTNGKTITFTGVGSCILVASSVETGTYAAAVDVSRTIVISKKPVATVAPTITMALAKQGQVATRTQGTWTASGGTLGYATQWYKCSGSSSSNPTTASVTGCTAVSGTGSSYTALSTDINKYLRVRITVTNFSGTSYQWTTTTGKITAP